MEGSSVDEPAPGVVIVKTSPFELVDTTGVNTDPSVVALIDVATIPEEAGFCPDLVPTRLFDERPLVSIASLVLG